MRGVQVLRIELHPGLAAAIAILASVGVRAAPPSGVPAGMPAMPAVSCSASEAGVGFVCGPRDVEDLVQVPGTDWLIGSETGVSQFPGSLVAIDTQAKSWHRIFPDGKTPIGDSGADCKAPPDPKKFTAVGLAIDVRSGKPMRLYAVERLRRAIEIFDLRTTGSGPEVSWSHCIPMPQGKPGNSVLPLPDGRFAVSTFIEDGFGFADLGRGLNTGRVLIWKEGQGFTELPGSFSSGANGLALSAAGDSIFLAVTGAKQVLKIALDGRGVLQRIALDFGPDNLRAAPDGSVLVAGRASEAACGDIPPVGAPPQPPDMKAMMCPRGVAVARVDSTTGAVQPVVRTTPNPNFRGGSGAAQVRDEIWLAAFPSAGVGYVKVK